MLIKAQEKTEGGGNPCTVPDAVLSGSAGAGPASGKGRP